MAAPAAEELAVGCEDASACLIDPRKRDFKTVLLQHFTGLHGASVRCVACSPSGGQLLLGSYDGTASVIDLATGRRTLHLEELHEEKISSVAWSPDGALLVLGSHDGTASLVVAATGERKEHFTGLHDVAADGGFVSSVSFCPDGEHIALGSGDATVSIVSGATFPLRLSLPLFQSCERFNGF